MFNSPFVSSVDQLNKNGTSALESKPRICLGTYLHELISTSCIKHRELSWPVSSKHVVHSNFASRFTLLCFRGTCGCADNSNDMFYLKNRDVGAAIIIQNIYCMIFVLMIMCACVHNRHILKIRSFAVLWINKTWYAQYQNCLQYSILIQWSRTIKCANDFNLMIYFPCISK